MELLKMLSANEIVAQAVSFIILLALLRIFAWKKLLKILDDRKQKIASDFKDIEDAKKGISELKSEYEEKLARIDEAARIKIEEALENGKRIAEEARKKAGEDAQGIIESAKESIKYEVSKAKEELKDAIVDLTIKAAENVIEEKLTQKQDRALIAKFLEDLDGAK